MILWTNESSCGCEVIVFLSVANRLGMNEREQQARLHLDIHW